MATRIKFERGTGGKKYRAIVYKNDRKIKTVQFGSIKHGQYRDSVTDLYKCARIIGPSQDYPFGTSYGRLESGL